MRKSAIITSAAFTGVLALTVIILSDSPTRAANECLAAPDSLAPAGSHWYYRLERPTQRKCWYLGPEGREVHAESSKARPAAKSSAAPVISATADQQIKSSRQTGPAHKSPSSGSDVEQTDSSVSTKGAATPAISATDNQPWASRQIDLAPVPSWPVNSDPEPAASVVQNSVPATADSVIKEDVLDAPVLQVQSITNSAQADAATNSAEADAALETSPQGRVAETKDSAKSATIPPIRVLLIPAALALAGVVAFAAFPSGLRRQIYAVRWRSNWDAITAQEKMPPNFNNADADPNLPAPQINMSNELKGNLRQVLQTLEAQLQEDVELEQEATSAASIE